MPAANISATYVDHILRGHKPGDLPVQFSVKYGMAVTLNTANALGLRGATVDSAARARGDRRISRRSPSHGPSGGVADSLDEAKAVFRAAWDAQERAHSVL